MATTVELPPIAVLPSAAPSSPAAEVPSKKGKGKENNVLQQAPLSTYVNGASGVSAKGKKRSLTLANGGSLDIHNASLPITKEVVEALRLRVIELEEQLAEQPPSKKPRTSKAASKDAELAQQSSSSATVAPAAKSKATIAAEAKKTNALIKKMWDRLQREVKTDTYKFHMNCKPKTVRFEEVIEEDEFDRIFMTADADGDLIQPRPDNKPNSTVTIVEYNDEGVEGIFKQYYKELKGNLYSLGGILNRFERGKKIGPCELEILSLHVNYSKNTMKCALKFEVSNNASGYNGVW